MSVSTVPVKHYHQLATVFQSLDTDTYFLVSFIVPKTLPCTVTMPPFFNTFSIKILKTFGVMPLAFVNQQNNSTQFSK